MDFGKYFESFKSKANENTLPSHLIPLEIQRWELYKKLVGHRSAKYLLADKEQFISYLRGDTLPLSRAYENHPMRCVSLNPMYDPNTKRFPMWEALFTITTMIGENYPEFTVKSGMNSALKDMITALKSLDLEALDQEVTTFEKKLDVWRKSVLFKTVIQRKFLTFYPTPEKLYGSN